IGKPFSKTSRSRRMKLNLPHFERRLRRTILSELRKSRSQWKLYKQRKPRGIRIPLWFQKVFALFFYGVILAAARDRTQILPVTLIFLISGRSFTLSAEI